MSKHSKIEVSIDKLKEFAESLKTRPVIEVGVFSNKTSRTDDMTNATLAAIHEHGDQRHGLPARSILITPLKDHAKEIMESMKDKAHQLVEMGKIAQTWKLIGIAAEKIILQAFSTEGFGKWAPLKYGTIMAKLKGSLKKRKKIMGQIYTGEKKGGILIDKGELRRSFSSRVRMTY